MNGNLWHEMARQRNADMRRAARQAGVARQARAAVRARRAADSARQAAVTPPIPDYPHEMFAELGGAAPAPRQEAGRGRRARTGR